MDSITVPFNKLYEFIVRYKNSEVNYITLSLLKPEKDTDGNIIPSTLMIKAFDSDVIEWFVEEYIECVRAQEV